MTATIPKRALAWLLAALVALVVAPGMAFAAPLTEGSVSLQADEEATWESIADDTVVLTVNVEPIAGEIKSVEVKKSEMEEMSKANTADAMYVFTSGKQGSAKQNTVVATKYVTIDQLLEKAGAKPGEYDTIDATEPASGDETAFTGASATYGSMKDRSFYPGYIMGATTPDTAGATATPGIVAIEFGSANPTANESAGQLVESAKSSSKYKGYLRNFWGKTADDLSNNMGGNSYVSNMSILTLHQTFNVYTRTGNGDKSFVKSYTQSALKALAKSEENGRGFLFNKSGWQVGVTTSFVPIADLLSDAGLTFAAGQSIAATGDGFTSTLSYDQVLNGKYFYPATTSSAIVADGAEEVGTVLALNWVTSTDEPHKFQETAGATKTALVSDVGAGTRLFTGLTSPSDPNTGGNRFVTGPVELSLITLKDIADTSISVSGVEATYDYTGKAIEPTVTVKDGDNTLSLATRKGGDYEVEYKDNTEAGTATITIKGVNAYTGTRTLTFKIVDKAAEQAAEKAAADQKAADAVTAQLNKLTDKSAAADVTAARKAYDALTADQKKLVAAATLAKLTSAEAAVAAAEKAAADKAAADKAAAEKAAADKAAAEKAAADKVAAEKAATTLKKGETAKKVAASGATVNVKATSSSAVTVTKGTAKSGATVKLNTVKVNGKTYKVTEVAKNAFKGTKAKKVTLGANVKTVGAGAFTNAKKLTTVTVGKNVKTIGKNAFKGDAKLKTVTLGKSVKSVGKNAFSGCKKLTKVTVKSSKLTKASFKNMLKGSKIKTVKLKGVSKAAKKNYKKWAKAYGVTVK